MGKAYTKKDLEKQLEGISETSKKKINSNPEMADYKTFKKYFGDSIHDKINLNESPKRYNLAKKGLLDVLRGKALRLGRTPTKQEVIDDKNMPDPNAYVYLFGSWKNAVVAAGLTPNPCGRPRKDSIRL